MAVYNAGMQLVETPQIFPAQCAIIPSGHGPFVDTHRVDAEGRRIYISLEAFNELDRVVREAGVATPAAQRIALLERELAEARAQVVAGDEARAELARLKDAVAHTLEAGRGAVQTKGGENRLRVKPGQRKVEV